jgi:hypothetical protein
MPQEKYEALIEDFCAFVNFNDPLHVLRGDTLEINGIELCFTYTADVDADNLYIYIDICALPQENEAEFYRSLLALNLYSFAGGGAVFGLSVNAGRVLLLERLPVDPMSGEAMHAALVPLVNEALRWRDELTGAAPSGGGPADMPNL